MTTQTPIPGAGKERTAGETAAFTACILLFHLLLLALAPSFCRPIEDPYLRVSALKGFQIAACLLPALLFRVWGDVREPLPRVRRKKEILLYSLIALAVVSAGLQINVTVNEFLSALGVDDLRFAIVTGDAKAIARAPGIGKKTAERLVLELRDRFNAEEFTGSYGEADVPAGSGDILSGASDEAIAALSALGYSPADAMRAVRSAKNREGGADLDTEVLLKAALKELI